MQTHIKKYLLSVCAIALLAFFFTSCKDGTNQGKQNNIEEDTIDIGSLSEIEKAAYLASEEAKIDTSAIYKEHEIKLYYATDRKTLLGKENFGNEIHHPLSQLSYGFTNISIPNHHQIGKLEIQKRISFFGGKTKADPSKYFSILKITSLTATNFMKAMGLEVAKSDEKSILVYIHGFNNSFNDAALRAAQLTHDIGFTGVPILFSWASHGKEYNLVSRYISDGENIRIAVEQLKNFLVQTIQTALPEKVHIIAHSMGNRAMTRALELISVEYPTILFDQIIMAAPDVNVVEFEQIAPIIKKQAKHFTIYSSKKDAILATSKQMNKNPRLGDLAPPFPDFENVQIVDASHIDISIMDAHSGYAQCEMILKDIECLLNSDATNDKRPIEFDQILKCWRVKRN